MVVFLFLRVCLNCASGSLTCTVLLLINSAFLLVSFKYLLLEVPLKELVSYLTAASALQMTQVVEKCAKAVSQYLSPTLAFLKLERQSEEKKVHQPCSLKNQGERDAAQPSTSNQEASTDEGRKVMIQSKSTVSQGAEVDSQALREVSDDRRVVIANIELSEDAACCLRSQESGEIQPFYQDHHITDGLRCTLHPPSAVRDHISSPTRGSSGQHGELVDSSQDRDEEAGEEQREEEEMYLVAAQLQECGELMDSNVFCLSRAHLPTSRSSGDDLTEASDGISVHRPYLCRRCDRVFQHLESYVGHLKEHRQYLCLVCGRGFSQKSNLSHHIRVHSGVKPFRCPLCHKTFSQKVTLQDHLNLHTGDKPHKCNYCAVHFAHKPGLRRHLKDIHGKSSLQNMLEEAVDS